MKRKLIEVSLPLDDINRESAREKSIRHGHPSTLHLWWARRPLASARAVLFAQLVDDPSSHPDQFPTEEAQAVERERLHAIIRELVKWENIGDEALYRKARAEILKSTGDNPPAILDPFAGGGAIPLEAQRLGLEAHASDLNPVAVLVNKALIEIPPKFAGQPPVFPGAADERLGDWPGAAGLAEDVRRYGKWMRDRAEEQMGHLYPKAMLEDGSEANVIAWIWARTVRCPNPACAIEMPLVRSWWLSRKKGKETYLAPIVVDDASDPCGKRVDFAIHRGSSGAPTASSDGTVGRRGARCVSCGASVDLNYVREQSREVGLGKSLMATVAEGVRQRVYLGPSDEHRNAAVLGRPSSAPSGEIFDWPGRINVYRYGMTQFSDLFTNRQLTALTGFGDLIIQLREKVLADARDAGRVRSEGLEVGGAGAEAYADAVSTYLGLAVSRTSNKLSAICTWDSSTKMESVRGVFSRQAIPMAWDFAEANPLASSSGSVTEDVAWVSRAVERVPAGLTGEAKQADAATRDYSNVVISTDPPYYDNICYSDLSDYFYVWLRRSLRPVLPSLFATRLVPKAEELVANPYRHGGADAAEQFFEDGFERVFAAARGSASNEYPIAVFYAFKQQERAKEGTTSTGWATVLEGMMRGGWSITATWPMDTEMGNRMIASGTNALASSIVIALRPRPEEAPVTDRRGFVSELREALPEAIATLRAGGVTPVDMAQAAIGPGMAVYSKFSKVFDSQTGERVDVKSALRLINQVLDDVRGDTEAEVDTDTGWCIAWYQVHGFGEAPYGDAETLAGGRNTSVRGLVDAGVVTSGGGRVALVKPSALPTTYDPLKDSRVTAWEIVLHLVRLMNDPHGGIALAGRMLAHADMRGINLGDVRALADVLFAASERRGMADAAGWFNALAASWPEIRAAQDDYASHGAGEVELQLDIEGNSY